MLRAIRRADSCCVGAVTGESHTFGLKNVRRERGGWYYTGNNKAVISHEVHHSWRIRCVSFRLIGT